MNSAKRLEKILSKIQSSSQTKALDVFEDVFEVAGCIEITSKLFLCSKQLEIIKDALVENQYKFLSNLFGCNTLARDMQAEKKQLPNHTASLHAMAHFMEDEKIEEEDLTKLYESSLELEKLLQTLELPQEHKEVIQRYIDEIHESIADIHIGGIDAFEHHIIIANGTVVLYSDAFKDEHIYNKIKEIFKTTSSIISNAQVWSGALGTALNVLIGK